MPQSKTKQQQQQKEIKDNQVLSPGKKQSDVCALLVEQSLHRMCGSISEALCLCSLVCSAV